MLLNSLEVRFFNTLHGFQMPTENEVAIGYIAKYRSNPDNFQELQYEDWPEHIAKIKEKAGEPAVEISIEDYLGYIYLKTNPAHRKQIPRIVDACVAAGYSIKLMTRLDPAFRANAEANLPFTIENSERIAIKQIIANYSYLPGGLKQYSELVLYDTKKLLLADERLWKSEEGKAFARELRATIRDSYLLCKLRGKIPLPEHDGLDPNIDFPLHTIPEVVIIDDEDRRRKMRPATEPSTAPVPAPAPAIQPAAAAAVEEDEDECAVCYDKKPNTLVLPCNHRVVCKSCSDKLHDTKDTAICLRCRRPITEVLWDGGAESKPGK